MQPTVLCVLTLCADELLSKTSLKEELGEVRLFLRFRVNAICHNTLGKPLTEHLNLCTAGFFYFSQEME